MLAMYQSSLFNLKAPNGRSNLKIPTDVIMDLADFILKNNNFEFDWNATSKIWDSY